MNTPKSKIKKKQNETEELYLRYFTPSKDIDENTSLAQPSPLEFVESSTSNGAIEENTMGSK